MPEGPRLSGPSACSRRPVAEPWRVSALPGEASIEPSSASPGVRSHCRVRNGGTEYVRNSGMEWMGGGAKRRFGRVISDCHPSEGRAENKYDVWISVYGLYFKRPPHWGDNRTLP